MTLKVGVIALLAWQLNSYVSVKNVIMNWPLRGDLVAHYRFLESAFLKTEFITLMLILGISALVLLLGRDFLRRSLAGARMYVGA